MAWRLAIGFALCVGLGVGLGSKHLFVSQILLAVIIAYECLLRRIKKMRWKHGSSSLDLLDQLISRIANLILEPEIQQEDDPPSSERLADDKGSKRDRS